MEADSRARQPPQQSGRPGPSYEGRDPAGITVPVVPLLNTDQRDSSTEGSSSPATPRRVFKRPLEDTSQPQEKRQKWDAGETLDGSETESGDILDFDPTELVKNREGTFVIPKSVETYLSKHLRQCLTKEEREALFKEHPRPDAEVCTVPKVDKYMTEYLGKQFPKEGEAQLTRIQTAILAILRPLTAAWRDLLDAGLKDNPDIAVPATEALSLIQRTICLVGNASELTSQSRREKILTAIDPSWSKFSSEEFSTKKNTLFGEEFQSKLTSMVERETALAKAVSITKRHKKERSSPPNKKTVPQTIGFFRKGPPGKYGDRRGKNFQPYTQYAGQNRDSTRGPYLAYNQTSYQQYNRPGQKPLFHEPRLPTSPSFQKPQQRKY